MRHHMPANKQAKRKAKPRNPSLAQRQREKSRKCLKDKKDGTLCTKPAGWGTDHPGNGPCKHHGGSTRNGAVGAAREEAKNMAKPLRVTPGQSILGVMHLAAGQLAFVSSKVASLEEDQTFETVGGGETPEVEIPNRWIRLQQSIMKDLARYARAAADMGIQERQQALQEAQTAMFHKVLEAVLDELELTREQRKAVGPAIRRQLPQFIEGQAQEVPA